MLFHSFSYIAIFFPIVLILFFLCRRIGSPAASWIWLLIASLFFYGWGDLASIPILIASMVVNYAIGTRLQKYTMLKGLENSDSRRLLVLGLVFNIALLGFFKYTDFVVANVNWALTIRIALPDIMLPLAISFFTFQQITYLADSYRGEIEGRGWLEYVTYVAFFPKLLSGPIVRYNELVPQLRNLPASIDYRNASIGLLLFFIGLLKVTTAARVFGTWADNGFAHAASLSLIDGWTASLSYTFQIYFDFSGYIDMAMGSARFFNIILPINFDSPYRAVNIQDFWRRWHITLSRFLRDYLYIPLGGNRKGAVSTYVNIIITFLICGIWHGAGWMFVIWGAMHGIGMALHRLWQRTKIKIPLIMAVLMTFLFVNTAWVFFRAQNITEALSILGAMTGFSPVAGFTVLHGVPASEIIVAVVSIAAVFAAPNTNRLAETFRPSIMTALGLTAVILIGLLYLNSSVPREFIYLDF